MQLPRFFNAASTLLASLVWFSFLCCEQQQPQDATFSKLQERLQKDSVAAKNHALYEKNISELISEVKQGGSTMLPGEAVMIPVVVHVVQQNGTSDLSSANVEEQIAALNRDFGRLNHDEFSLLPEAFRILAADTRIRFKLANVGPNREATTGIIFIKSTRKAPFSYDPLEKTARERSPIKSKDTGGSNAWPSNRYLNIWVCELDPSLGAGYASLPADFLTIPEEDGIVIDKDFFGLSASKAQGKGRTLTNLTAKWLGLKDIWGTGNVVGADGIDDTPPSSRINTGKPSFPLRNSSTNPYGEMYCNFMDATDDDARIMFTVGQATQMYSGLFAYRKGFSRGLGISAPSPSPLGAPPARDYFIKDNATDDGSEPNSWAGSYWQSPSIYVTRTSGGSSAPPMAGTNQNYIHVLVDATDNNSDLNSPELNIWYIDANATNLTWPTYWTQINSRPLSVSQPTPGTPTDVTLQWDLSAAGAPGVGHYCLIAELTAPTCGSRGTCDSDHKSHVKINNNAAWKNVDIVAFSTTGGEAKAFAESTVTVGNATDRPIIAQLHFKDIEGETSAFELGQVLVSDQHLIDAWEKGGRRGEGIERRDSHLVILKTGAFLDNLQFEAGKLDKINMRFTAEKDKSKQRNLFALNIEQWDNRSNNDFTSAGGLTFLLKTEHTEKFPHPPPIKNNLLWLWLLLAAAAALFVWQRWRKKG